MKNDPHRYEMRFLSVNSYIQIILFNPRLAMMLFQNKRSLKHSFGECNTGRNKKFDFLQQLVLVWLLAATFLFFVIFSSESLYKI